MPFHYDKVLQERFWLSDEEMLIANLPTFLKKKGIKQNGFSYIKYPDATGTRYDHSVGTLYWASKLYHSIFPNASSDIIKNTDLRALRIAAILHDIGHGPFSHALEELLYRNEKWFTEEPWKGLKEKFGNKTPHELLTLNFLSSPEFIDVVRNDAIRSKCFNILNKKNVLYLLISGDLDADRLDYLTRDSHYSGLPFGFNIKVIFNEILEGNFRIKSMKGNNFLILDIDALPAMEQFLLARYAHYKYIAYELTVLHANLIFVSSLEKSLENNIKLDEDIAKIIYNLFIDLTDDEMLRLNFFNISDDEVQEKLQPLKNDIDLKNMFENIEKSCNNKIINFIRVLKLGKSVTYNLLKGERFVIREIEKIFSDKFHPSIKFFQCIPSTLTMRTCVLDPDVNSKYAPSLIYDSSPIVRGLEQKMYLDCGILMSSDEELDVNKIIEEFNTLSRGKIDFDVYTYAVVKYISRIISLFDEYQSRWERRRTRLFEFFSYLNKTLIPDDILTKPINFETPWYSVEMYGLLQKLEFLDVIAEDFNVRHGVGFIPFFVYSKGDFADDILDIVNLSKEDRECVDRVIEEYIKRYRIGLP